MSHALDHIRQVARQRKKEKFTARFHHINPEMLRTAFYALKRDAAPGVDGTTWRTYEADLDQWIADLHDRFNGERIVPCRHGERIYRSQTDGSARLRSPPSKTRSSRGRRRRC